jgi:hypothetical protein
MLADVLTACGMFSVGPRPRLHAEGVEGVACARHQQLAATRTLSGAPGPHDCSATIASTATPAAVITGRPSIGLRGVPDRHRVGVFTLVDGGLVVFGCCSHAGNDSRHYSFHDLAFTWSAPLAYRTELDRSNWPRRGMGVDHGDRAHGGAGGNGADLKIRAFNSKQLERPHDCPAETTHQV